MEDNEPIIVNHYEDDALEEDILQKMIINIEKCNENIQKAKKRGVNLRVSENQYKRRTYSHLSQLAKKKKLSEKSLEWLADFAKNGPYEDIREFFSNHAWVDQYRDLTAKKFDERIRDASK